VLICGYRDIGILGYLDIGYGDMQICGFFGILNK
jgi:hypothetical protein